MVFLSETPATTINLVHLLHKVGVRAVLGQTEEFPPVRALDGEAILYLQFFKILHLRSKGGRVASTLYQALGMYYFILFLSHMTDTITRVLLLRNLTLRQ